MSISLKKLFEIPSARHLDIAIITAGSLHHHRTNALCAFCIPGGAKIVLVECPHCHLRVDPSSRNGDCPACDGDLNNVDGVNPNRALLLMKPTARMPEVCCQCGVPTSEMVDLLPPEDGSAVVHGLLATSAFQPLVWLMNQVRRLAHTEPSRTFPIPLCEYCRDKRVTPIALHPSDDFYQCPVHIDFKNRYHELNHNSKR